MVSTIASIAVFFPSPAPSPVKRTTKMMLRRKAVSFGTHGMKSKLVKENTLATSIKDRVGKILKMGAHEKQRKLLHRRKGEEPMGIVADPFGLGEVGKDRRIFCENFRIRSYHIGPNRTASIDTLMNLSQETILNNIRRIGIIKDELGVTPEMFARSLIWVLSKIHIVVDYYPSWGEDVQVDNWFIRSSKISQPNGWTFRDCQTGRTLMQANSVYVMMNKKTRKMCKIPEEVRRDMEALYIEEPIPTPGDQEDSCRIAKFDYHKMDYIRTGLLPRWNDLDVNQHVNNVKYIGLLLESVPRSILESHEIYEMNIEYKRECRMDDKLQSLTSVCDTTSQATDDEYMVGGSGRGHHEFFHLLRFENGDVAARGKTKWRAK